MLMEIGLEKADGAVFGVGNTMASLSAFSARVANHIGVGSKESGVRDPNCLTHSRDMIP